MKNTKDSPLVCDAATLRAYKKKYNFFETPDTIAEKMAELLDDLGRIAEVLEPSAGRGKLIKAVQNIFRFDTQCVCFCEIQPELCAGITDADRIGGDFLTVPAEEIFDAVIMNPPFSKRQDIAHVEHAWKFLKPGGKMVALVSVPCAEYIDEEFVGHVFVREVFEMGFEETTVTTVMFLLHKPLDGKTFAEDSTAVVNDHEEEADA